MIGINFPFAEKEEKEMSSPSRLKGEKDRGGSAHCFVNIFFLVARQTEGGRRKERGINTLWRRLAASFVAYGMR